MVDLYWTPAFLLGLWNFAKCKVECLQDKTPIKTGRRVSDKLPWQTFHMRCHNLLLEELSTPCRSHWEKTWKSGPSFSEFGPMCSLSFADFALASAVINRICETATCQPSKPIAKARGDLITCQHNAYFLCISLRIKACW